MIFYVNKYVYLYPSIEQSQCYFSFARGWFEFLMNGALAGCLIDPSFPSTIVVVAIVLSTDTIWMLFIAFLMNGVKINVYTT